MFDSSTDKNKNPLFLDRNESSHFYHPPFAWQWKSLFWNRNAINGSKLIYELLNEFAPIKEKHGSKEQFSVKK